MHRFCPQAEPTVIAIATGYRVSFRHYGPDESGGGCNLEEDAGHRIHGLVYELSDAEYDELDRISGVDRDYYRRVEIRLTSTDGEMTASTYIMPNPGDAFRPSAGYVRPILAGAAVLNLSADYQAELQETVRVATVDI